MPGLEDQNLDPEQFNPEQPGGAAIRVPKKTNPFNKAGLSSDQGTDNQDQSKISATFDQIKKQATQYVKKIASKYLTRAVIIPSLPYILVVILIIILVVLAIVFINKYYKGFAGRSQAQATSIYNADDMTYIQQILGQNSGGMICPLLRKSKGDIGSVWAKKRGSYTHRGIDIGAPNQTPLYAATDGKIVYLKDDLANNVKGYGSNANGGFGNTIIVQVIGGKWDGFFWEIHHLYPESARKAGLKLGNIVKQGQAIGSVGDNGASSDPHLHFQVDIPTMVNGNRTQSGCSNVILESGRPCGAGASNRYRPDLDTINPIIPLGW